MNTDLVARELCAAAREITGRLAGEMDKPGKEGQHGL